MITRVGRTDGDDPEYTDRDKNDPECLRNTEEAYQTRENRNRQCSDSWGYILHNSVFVSHTWTLNSQQSSAKVARCIENTLEALKNRYPTSRTLLDRWTRWCSSVNIPDEEMSRVIYIVRRQPKSFEIGLALQRRSRSSSMEPKPGKKRTTDIEPSKKCFTYCSIYGKVFSGYFIKRAR